MAYILQSYPMADKSDNNKTVKLSVREFPEDMRDWLKLEAVKRKINMGEFLVELCEFWKKHHEEK